MELMEKLSILTASAKYDAACTSSGVQRSGQGGPGATCAPGVCHSFAADGRCISLLKVLMTNVCVYDCQYCVNRRSNDVPRAAFTPDELADLTMEFYRRNYIEGLFLSSGVSPDADGAMERMCRVLERLRYTYGFRGYIHAKAIPGCSPGLVTKLGALADRMSVNIELPSEKSLAVLAPDKSKQSILAPMGQICDGVAQSREELVRYRHAPAFAPAGQSTQMIIGATPDTDRQILRLSEGLYRRYRLKRVFYSAYIPVGTHALLPRHQPPPLLREHRLYQADWLIRKYGFAADELLDDGHPSLDVWLDPKCQWALRHWEQFPVEVNRAPEELLVRVPGIGLTAARRIVTSRRVGSLSFDDLRALRVVLKRAVYFITCRGKAYPGVVWQPQAVYDNLVADARREIAVGAVPEQLSLFTGTAV